MPIDVTEYSDLATAGNGQTIVAGQEPSLTTQQVVISGASLASNAFGDATRFVRVHADEACRVAFGPAPVASATSQRMPAEGTEYFGVRPGHKIAVISSS